MIRIYKRIYGEAFGGAATLFAAYVGSDDYLNDA